MDTFIHDYDAVIVGAGGAGLRSALAARKGFAGTVAVVSKVFPTASGTSAARGGIGGALGREEEDRVEWHIRDTLRGSDYLADEDVVETVCREAEEIIVELERLGMPFNRSNEALIGQRKFAGHYGEDGVSAVKRACFCGDYSGQALVQTLYDHCRQLDIDFFNEFHLLELLTAKNQITGFVAFELATGQLHLFNSPAVLLAGGGAGQLYSVNSNARSTTGDLQAIALRAGALLEDMEFIQFHPTGLAETGVLITEAARGCGGILKNKNNERFMKKYAPEHLELAGRDTVARAIQTEISEGRGNQAGCVCLDISHIDKTTIQQQLPELIKTARTFKDIDIFNEPLPVQPVAHYFMGGIATDLTGGVLSDSKSGRIEGLFAAGECGCLSLHGANRLGTNSLLEIMVMGRRAGESLSSYAKNAQRAQNSRKHLDKWKKQLNCNDKINNAPSPGQVRKKLQTLMTETAGIFRENSTLEEGTGRLKKLRELAAKTVANSGKNFNYSLIEKIELDNMLLLAEVIIVAASNRKETRGAHYRTDYPQRDDKNWQKHSLVRLKNTGLKIDYKKANCAINE